MTRKLSSRLAAAHGFLAKLWKLTAPYFWSEERWSARRGHLGINTHLATHDLDLKKRTESCTMTMDVYTPTQKFQIVDELVFRTYTWKQMQKLLATISELELAAIFDFTYQIDDSIKIGPETQDVVLILRRK